MRASDVFDYGCGYEVGSFVGFGPDVASVPSVPDWIITNPPFNLACKRRRLDQLKRPATCSW